MTTLDKLNKAYALIEEAASLLNAAQLENDSLYQSYGYCIGQIADELRAMIGDDDNSRTVILNSAIDACGEEWQDSE